MATIAVAGLGAAAGYAIGGPVGASIGWGLGSYLGSQLWPTQLPDVEGPRVTDLSASQSAYGIPRTRLWGTVACAGNLIWTTDLQETRDRDTTGGGKGGATPEQTITTYSYSVSAAWGFCEGPVSFVRRIWFDSELVYDHRDTNRGISIKDGVGLRVYLGNDTQMPDPIIEANEGVGDTPAYRGTCYIVVQDLPLAEYGNRRPNVRAEIVREVTPAGTAYLYSTETMNTMGFDPTTGWVYGNDQSAEEVYVNDAYTGTLISTWTPGTQALGNDEYGIASARNGYIYGQGWYDGSNQYLVASDLITGETIWKSDTGNVAGSGITDEGIQAHQTWLVSIGLLSDDVAAIWEYNPDGSLEFVYETTTNGGNDIIQLSAEEPDTGYLWFSYTLGSAYPAGGVMLVELDLNPDYPYYSATKWTITQSYLDCTDAFDANGDPASPAGSGVAADNFYYMRHLLQYDPTTQSILVTQWDDNAGARLAEGIYRLECTTRHDLTTMRIAGVKLASDSDLTLNEANSHMNIGNPLRGDGLGYYWNGGATNTLLEFDTTTMTTVTLHTWGNPDPLDNLLSGTNGPVADWSSSVIFGYVIGGGAHSIFWNRAPAQGVGLDAVVEEICTRHGLDTQEVDVTDLATKTVEGYAIGRPTKARTQLATLMAAYHFDAVESDRKLKFQFKGRASLVTVPEDDLAAHEPGTQLPDDLVLKRKELYQLPKTVQVTCVSRELEYEPSNQYSRQPTSPTEDILKLEFPLVLSDDEAAQIAEVWIQSLRSERHSGSLRLGPYYFEYDPTDPITVNRGSLTYTFRITKTSWGPLPGITRFDVTTYDPSAYTSNATGVAPIGFQPTTLNRPPLTAFFMVDTPPLRDTDDDAGFYAAFAAYTDAGNWAGGTLQRRDAANDTDSFVTINTHIADSVIANEATNTALPAGANATTWDWTNSLNVRVWNGETLASDSELDVLNGRNLLAFPQTGELLQFQTATLEADGTYTLTGLLRGRRGTDVFMDDHIGNEAVVYVDPAALYKIDDILSNVGRTFTYAAVGFGSNIDRARKQNWTQQGRLITPLSPVGLTSQRETNGDLSLSWIRRARLNAEWLDNIDVPLDEPVEEYDVELYRDTTLLRTVRVSGLTTYTYTLADQTTDHGAQVPQFNYCVYQISDRVGRGYGACYTPILEAIATDFDEYITTEQPSDWTEVQGGVADWTVQDAGGGDHYVRSSRTSANHNFLRWDRVDAERDVEVLVKTRTTLNTTTGGSGTTSLHGIILRATGAPAGILVGFWGDTGTASTALWAGVTDTYTDTYNHPTKKMLTNTWWWIRARVQGDDLRIKWWADSGSEPSAWDYETTQTTYPNAGDHMLMGAYEYWGGPEDFDFFSIAYNGQTAPSTA